MVRRKNKFKIVIYILLFALLIETALLMLMVIKGKDNTLKQEETDKTYLDFDAICANLEGYKEINEDYTGQMVFDSGLVDIPFFQAKSLTKKSGGDYVLYDKDGNVLDDTSSCDANDVYKWINYETMEYDYDDMGGSVYMDYRNDDDDQNVIIYGNLFTKDSNVKNRTQKNLTALEALATEQDKHIGLKLYLDWEIKEYELWAVYNYKVGDPEFEKKCQYSRTNYSVGGSTVETNSQYMNDYIQFVNSIKLYDTGVDLLDGDKTLTIVLTPVSDSDEIQICVFKLTYLARYVKK